MYNGRAMSWKDKSLEVKVGLFLFVSLGILVGFVLFLGNFSFEAGHPVQVDFPTSGGLRPGAKVKVAGVKAGKVEEIRFLGGRVLNEEGKPIYVRVQLQIDKSMATSVTEGSVFYITTEGLLGEKYVEISPGPPDAPQIPAGAGRSGLPPAELQAMTTKAVEMMDKVQKLMETKGEGLDLTAVVEDTRILLEKTRSVAQKLDHELPGLIQDSRATLERTRQSLDRLDNLLSAGADTLSGEAGLNALLKRHNELAARIDSEVPDLVDEAKLVAASSRQLISDTGRKLENIEGELTSTAAQARKLIANTNTLVTSLDAKGLMEPAQATFDKISTDLADTGTMVKTLTAKTGDLVEDLSSITTDIREGRGTLGAFITDREIYDDVRELVLDLKRNPWKVLWKP